MKKYIVLFFCFLLSLYIMGQGSIIAIWNDNIPNQNASEEKEIFVGNGIGWIENVQVPTLEVFLPSKQSSTGQAVLICPGGGYAGLSYEWEGTDVAKWFNSKGIAAFVLKSRLPKSKSIIVAHKAPLQDAQRAIRIIRYNAEKWHVNKNKVGLIGFSAGGHLASMLGTHFNEVVYPLKDSIDKEAARPDFMALIYPVITMSNESMHVGSRNNLIGTNSDKKLKEFYSAELNVTSSTPPTILIHASDDEAVPVENSILFYQALLKEGVGAEVHFYPTGGHGFGLAIGQEYLNTWPDRVFHWLNNLN